MSRKLAGVFVAMVLVLAVACVYVMAAEDGPADKDRTAPDKLAVPIAAAPAERPAMAAPAGGGEAAPSTPEEMMARSEERLKRGNASEALLMRNRQMQMARFQLNEPIGLLALKAELKLTPEQAAKLEEINAAACKQAQALLTPEQSATLAKMEGTPDTMLALSAEARRMGGGRGGRGGGE